jgi:membrane protein implicated in regulation of membrane protease activity
MRKADLERALKKTTGAALKEVVVKVGDTYWKIDSVRYDPETDRVVITVE